MFPVHIRNRGEQIIVKNVIKEQENNAGKYQEYNNRENDIEKCHSPRNNKQIPGYTKLMNGTDFERFSPDVGNELWQECSSLPSGKRKEHP